MLGRSSTAGIFAAVVSLSGPNREQAEGPPSRRLAVLPAVIAGARGETSELSVWEDVREVVQFRIGLGLAVREERSREETERLVSELGDCGSNLECLGSHLRSAGVDLGLLVVINLQMAPPFMSLQLIDADAEKVVGASRGRIDPALETVSSAVRRGAGALLAQAGYVEAGRVLVDVSPPGARVTAGDRVVQTNGEPPGFLLLPGKYQLRSELTGRSDALTEVEVRPGTEVRASLVLAESPSVLTSVWLWAAVGVAAVAGGVALAVVAGSGPAERRLCVAPDGAPCP